MDYLMKASGLVILLFLFYQLFLKNETFFKSIRSYFLIGLLIVLSLPLLEIPIYVEYVSQQFDISKFEVINSTEVKNASIDWVLILGITYFIGVVFFSLKFLVQLISLAHLIFSHKSTKQGNHLYIETTKEISPFSFFNYIVFNNKQFTSTELEQIINHEKAHVTQWHSLDTLLAHILVILLWFNPFVWLYKKAVQQNLEFLADSYALQQTDNHKFYQLTLLKTFQQNYCTDTTNNFYNSLIKKRITMLHKNRSTNKSQWKYALLIPLLMAFVFSFNTKTIAQEKKLIEVIEESNDLKVDLLIDKNSTAASLKKESDFFKSEFDIKLSFKGIKRNSENEITAIKIDAKGENLKAKFENSGNETIKPIKISYDADNNYLSISNVSKLKNKSYSYTIHSDGDVKLKGDKKANYLFVSSDGKKKTWTTKGDKNEKIIIKEIHKGDKEHVLIKKGDENSKVEVIEIFEDEYKVHIISDDNEETEIKNITAKNGNSLFFSSDKEKPIVYIDGKLSTNEVLQDLDPDFIKSMSVLKGDSAIKEYGGKAKNGVILITTKKTNSTSIKIDKNTSTIKGLVFEEGKNPLYIINGIEKTNVDLKKIAPDDIESISVLKGASAIDKYGDKGKNGVILITLKKK